MLIPPQKHGNTSRYYQNQLYPKSEKRPNFSERKQNLYRENYSINIVGKFGGILI